MTELVQQTNIENNEETTMNKEKHIQLEYSIK